LVKKGQVYKHFKGNYYYVEDIAYDSASNDGDLKEIVVYRALYGDNKLWIRPIEEFESEKLVSGIYVKRFILVEFEKIEIPNRNI
jgi:hypothetical protein